MQSVPCRSHFYEFIYSDRVFMLLFIYFDESFSAVPFLCPAKLPCPPTRPYKCRNGRVCLRLDQVCNKVDDCGDNSDEDECGERNESVKEKWKVGKLKRHLACGSRIVESLDVQAAND